ncbi:hypothetical protein PAPYR_8841 [Paratrimastix pyriformis]|uniref:Uncharacterized protein n=1 Tax=Paratrimastix pyriformis TaxID=342808 RepID=A0ABQ8UGY3_9EUKA|nr:hypothetical protein PAPYR_8841 [Paratrimastix pyriformis]
MWQCYLKYRDDAPPSHSRHSSASSTDDSSDLQLRQNVFLRVPINVVGDRDVSIPGVRLALAQEGCAYGGDLHTCPEVTLPSLSAPPLPPRCRPLNFSWLRASTVYVCYTHARWYVGSKPPPFRPF